MPLPRPLTEGKASILTTRISNTLLAVLCIISCVPWLIAVILGKITPGNELEGAIYVSLFCGLVSFGITGPGIAVVFSMRGSRSVTLSKFALTFWTLSIPILAFETFATASSATVAFAPRFLYSTAGLSGLMVFSGAVAIAVYGVYFVVLYGLAKEGPFPTFVGGIVLALLTYAAIFIRLLQ
jgi:hypothetical protein